MARHTAIGVHDQLPPGQSAVAVRSANNKPAGWVYEKFGVLISHTFRDHSVKHMLFNILMDLLLGNFRIVLCREHYGIQAEGNSAFIVFYRHLSLTVRTQIWQRAVFAHLCQPA